MKRILFLIILSIASFVTVNAHPTLVQYYQQSTQLTEAKKIELLLSYIENLKGAKFYRNGEYYDAKAAASHLRMKNQKAGSSVKTARDFIDKIATKSSMTGEAYKIKLENGKEYPAKDILMKKLLELEVKK